MEIFLGIVGLLVVAWLWRSRHYDKQTTLDFDVWLANYEAVSNPLQQSRMAVAFISQSIHMAWSSGIINSKQRDIVTATLKSQRATTTLMMWFGSALPAVIRAVGRDDLSNSPARMVGMLILLAWISPEAERENAVRQFVFRR